jgi:hypothetical protein
MSQDTSSRPTASAGESMGTIDYSVWIQASPEDLWRIYIDPIRIPEWQTGSPVIEHLHGSGDQAGTTYVSRRRPGAARTTIMEVKKRRRPGDDDRGLFQQARPLAPGTSSLCSSLNRAAPDRALPRHLATRFGMSLHRLQRIAARPHDEAQRGTRYQCVDHPVDVVGPQRHLSSLLSARETKINSSGPPLTAVCTAYATGGTVITYELMPTKEEGEDGLPAMGVPARRGVR